MRKNLVLILILLLAAFFRLYLLNQVPPSPSLDEVSLGWNAYSISEIGRDEYGTPWPVLLRAYDDWRPALYVYLVIPFVKLLGLSAMSVRLPSVLLSLVAVWLTYLLTMEFLGKKRVALIASFLLAISPWHIYLSRLGHEVNAGLILFLLAIFFFWKAVKRKGLVFLIASAIFWSLSFYTYQSQKVFGPLLLLSLGLIFRKQLWQMKKAVIIAGLIGLILLIPLAKASFTPEALIRFQGTSIFANQPELDQRAAERMARNYQQGNYLGLILDNRRVALGLTVLEAYSSHFNPSWLFFSRGAEDHKIPNLGLFYLWELPLLLIGACQLVTGRFSRQSKLLLFSWLLIAPAAASIATGAPHAMRAFNATPVPQILAALGAATLFKKIKPKSWQAGLAAILVILSLAFMFHNYFVNFPREQSDSFQYPLAQAIKHVLSLEGEYKKVAITNQDHGYQSYMFLLFFSQYNPKVYQFFGGTLSGGFEETHRFDQYEFRPIDWPNEEKEEGTLYLGNIDDFPEETVPLKEFPLLSGDKAMVVVE